MTSDIIYQKHYEIKLREYLKEYNKCSNRKIINQQHKNRVFNYIMSSESIFLKENCPHCLLSLVDPTGLCLYKDERFRRHAFCGRCGYNTTIKYNSLSY